MNYKKECVIQIFTKITLNNINIAFGDSSLGKCKNILPISNYNGSLKYEYEMLTT